MWGYYHMLVSASSRCAHSSANQEKRKCQLAICMNYPSATIKQKHISSQMEPLARTMVWTTRLDTKPSAKSLDCSGARAERDPLGRCQDQGQERERRGRQYGREREREKRGGGLVEDDHQQTHLKDATCN